MNKLKKIKLFLLAIIAIFTIVACDKDLYEEAINQDKEINIKQISLEKFNSKMRQMKNKPEIERFMVSSRNGSALSRTESTSEFEIITDDIKEITQGDYTSYTMYLKTPDTTNNIYNITIEEIDGNSSFFITKYIPKTYWLENKNLPFDGEIITYRESNTNSSGANTLQEYLDLIYGELYAGGAGGGSLSLTGTSGGTSWSTGLGGSPIYPQNCNGTVKTDYILEPHACASGNHMPGQSCEYLNPSYAQYNPNNGPYYELTPYYTCVPNTPSSGNTSGSGDTSGGNTLGGGGSGSGTGTGSGGTSTGAVTGSITTIVDPTEECNAPRGDLNNDCMLDENEANFVTFLDNLTPEERRLVNGDNNLKMSFFNYLKGQSWSNESEQFAMELMDTSIQLEINVIEIWFNDYETFRNQMSNSERAIFDSILPNRQMWYMASAYKALEKSNELFPNTFIPSNSHNGKGDAFRHALWNAYFTGFCGATLAEQLTTAHEENIDPNNPFPQKEIDMDLFNNQKGRLISSYSNINNVTQNVLDYLNSGGLRYLNVLNPNPPYYPTIYSTLIPTNQ